MYNMPSSERRILYAYRNCHLKQLFYKSGFSMLNVSVT